MKRESKVHCKTNDSRCYLREKQCSKFESSYVQSLLSSQDKQQFSSCLSFLQQPSAMIQDQGTSNDPGRVPQKSHKLHDQCIQQQPGICKF